MLEQPSVVTFITGTSTALVDSLELDQSSLTMAPGDSIQLSAKGYDAAGQEISVGAIVWSTEDTTIARVAATGMVTAMRNGITTVIASISGRRGQRPQSAWVVLSSAL